MIQPPLNPRTPPQSIKDPIREESEMPTPQKGNVPKIDATRTRAPNLAGTDADEHDERLIDESVDESFPASDPPAVARPDSSLAVKQVAESGRAVPPAEPDPAKEKLQPNRDKP
jgi:hypothetical protein